MQTYSHFVLTKAVAGFLKNQSAGCGFHTAIDIPLHHDDGPLLWFPFNWTKRYVSRISYWDPKRSGRLFFIFEHLIIGIVLSRLLKDWRRDRRRRQA